MSEVSESQIYEKIGEFVFRFSGVEFALRWMLAGALDLPAELWDAVPRSYDFKTLCAVTLQACEVKFTEAKKLEITKLIKRCYKLNDIRNRIVHGTWSVGETNSPTYRASHMSRQTLKVTEYFGDFGELVRAADECDDLGNQLFMFALGAFFMGKK